MLIRNVENPACILNLLPLLFKNGHIRSFFYLRTKPSKPFVILNSLFLLLLMYCIYNKVRRCDIILHIFFCKQVLKLGYEQIIPKHTVYENEHEMQINIIKGKKRPEDNIGKLRP